MLRLRLFRVRVLDNSVCEGQGSQNTRVSGGLGGLELQQLRLRRVSGQPGDTYRG